MGFLQKQYSRKSEKSRLFLWIFLTLSIAIALFIVWLILQGATYSFSSFGLGRTKEALLELWHSDEFAELSQKSSDLLNEQPVDPDLLILHGFSSFYAGIEEPDTEIKYNLFLDSVFSLRKALIVSSEQYHPEIHYVLGKAYFHLGNFYYDASLFSLSRAYEAGYYNSDIYEYIGLANRHLRKLDDAVFWLEKALSNRFSPVISLSLAEVLFEIGDYDEARNYAIVSAEEAGDMGLASDALLLAGRSLIEQEQFLAAESHFKELIEGDKGTADARYWLGETYFRNGDPIQARAEWREAVRIDPSHALSVSRLQQP
ncbi:tetratricopeptide repeat protein [Spirochaeta dissipatitropha]